MFPEIIRILKKYAKEDFNSMYMFLSPIAGLARHLYDTAPEDHESNLHDIEKLMDWFELDAKEREEIQKNIDHE